MRREPFIGPPKLTILSPYFIGPPEDDDGWKAAMCRIRGEYSWQQRQVGPATGHSERMDDDVLHSLEDDGDTAGHDRLMKIIFENLATEP
jgi:hypothetical protein